MSKCHVPIVTFQAVFELRKNKWLYNGQPGFNLWLSVQDFGCPYLEFYKI